MNTARTGSRRAIPRGAYNTKKTAAVVGVVAGGAAFGITLLAAPAVIQAATYGLAAWMATWASASVATYVGAMVAVGVMAAIAGALLALAVRFAVNKGMDIYAAKKAAKPGAGARLDDDEDNGTEMQRVVRGTPPPSGPQRQHNSGRPSAPPAVSGPRGPRAAANQSATLSGMSMLQQPPQQASVPAGSFGHHDHDDEFAAAPAPAPTGPF